MSTISSTSLTSLYASPLVVPNITVPKTSDPSLVRAATSISEEAGILASMGNSSSIPQTSDPAGLLGWFLQPYGSTSLTSAEAGNPGTSVQASIDQQILGGISSNNSSSNGIYNSGGTVQNQSADSSGNWASLVKSNPSLSGTMTSDMVNMTILSQLSTYA